jgi:hypothetical protein
MSFSRKKPSKMETATGSTTSRDIWRDIVERGKLWSRYHTK